MKYHAPTRQFVIGAEAMNMASLYLLYSIRKIRELAELPLTRYKREGALTAADHAQKGIIDAAKAMNIDLGADWVNDLDVSEVG